MVRPTQLQFVDDKISYIIEVKISALFPDFRTEQKNKRNTGFFIVCSCYFWPGKNKKGNHNSYYELSVKRDTLLGFTSVHFWVEELLTQFSSLTNLSIWPLLLFLFRLERLSSFGVNCLPSHPSLIITSRGESKLTGSWIMVVIDLLQSRFPIALTTKKWYFLVLKWNWSEKFFWSCLISQCSCKE